MATKVKLIADNAVTAAMIDTTATPTFGGITVNGDATVTGDLNITGNLNSYNVTDLDVTDQTITLGAGQTEALSGGSGIIVDGSGASILWDETNTEWDFNNSINVTGTVTADGLTVDGTSNEVISVNSTANGSQINFNSATTSSDWIVGIANDATDDFLIYQAGAGAGDIRLYTEGAERLTILNGGNIGIGTSNPANTLSVQTSTGGISATFTDATYSTLKIDHSDTNGAITLKNGANQNYAVFGGNNTILYTGATERMRIDSSGRLAINTTDADNKQVRIVHADGTPALCLSLNSGTGSTKLQFGDSGDSDIGQITYDHTSNFMALQVNNAERMRIDSSGNVGIGAAPTNFSNYNNLDVRSKNASGGAIIGIHDTDGARVGAISHSEASPAFDIEAFNNNPIRFFTNTTERLRITSGGDSEFKGNIAFTKQDGMSISGYESLVMQINSQNNQSGRVFQVNNYTTPLFVVQQAGNVGIATSNPSFKLHVANGSEVASYFEGNDQGYTQGAICLASDTSDTNGYRGQGTFYFNHGSDTTWYTGGVYTNADSWHVCRQASTTTLATSTAQASNALFSVKASGTGGAVGVNINNPDARAYFIIRPVATSGTTLELTNAAGNRMWFYIMDGHYGYQGVEQIYANGGYNRYFTNTSGTAVGSIVVNSGSTAFNTNSDYRLKDNPQPLTGSGEFIDALQPKTWTWNHGDGGTGVGFIAHEAAEVGLGLCVTGEKDAESIDKVWNEETQEFEEQVTPTYQQVDYSNGELIANMVAELQSLRARVAELENN